MKKTIKSSILILILIFGTAISYSQITKNVLKTPCNCDGEIEYTYVGASLPLTVYYKLPGRQYYSKTLTTTNKDTIKNVCQGVILAEANNYLIRDTFNIFTISNIAINHAFCPNLGSIGATVSGGTAPISYSCYDIKTNSIVGTSNPISIPEGEYIFTIKDANGCACVLPFIDSFNKGGDTISIYGYSNINYMVNTTDASCTNGTAAITGITGGTAPYSYLWFNGNNTSSISGLIQGWDYTAKVIDATGCSTTKKFYIQQNPIILTNYTQTPATCTQSDGALTAFGAGGQNPYMYKWSNGATTQSITGLNAGNYNFTVTDKNGCIGMGNGYVVASTPINITYNSTPSACTNPTGSATLNITGGTSPYNTVWYLSPSNATGATLTGQSAGTYSFKVTDVLGCVQTGAAVIEPISSPSINYTKINPICPASNGSITLSTIGVNPLSYTWSNGSSNQNLNGIAPGGYAVTVKDGNNCKTTKSFYIENLPSFNINMAGTNVSCIYSKDGTASAVAIPSGSYTYSWSNGNTGSSISGLGRGYYTVVATKPNGCMAEGYIKIDNNATSDACYCIIKGKVYHDANNNCTIDAGENGIDNIMIHLEGLGSTFTDVNGNYEFYAPSGTYKLKQEVKSIFPMSSCQQKEYNVTVNASSGCTQTFNFADSLIPSRDLFLVTMNGYRSAIVPGEVYSQRLIIKNIGNVPENTVKMGYKHDNQLRLLSTTTDLSMTSSTRVDQSASYPSLNPSAENTSYLQYQVPTNIPMNTNVIFIDTVAKALPLSSEWLEDLSPWNNVNYYNGIVVSSYDPNYKEVLPRGTGDKGIIPKTTKQLTYTIHFQNLGTYYAKKVELIDTLDKNLDWKSLSPITSSHKFKTFVEENGVVRFLFDNIYLPAEKDGGDASNGFVTYTINLNRDLIEGTEVKNFADIYFDYNEPVRTNTTINTIEKLASSINSYTQDDKIQFELYPNPAIDKFNITISAPQNVNDVDMTIYDLKGKSIYSWGGNVNQGENKKEFNTENLSNGIYIINLQIGNEKFSKKLVVNK